MASTANSTRTPSRRQFFGSAAGAGMAAAQPPIFTAAIFAADAALLALGAKFAVLYEAADRACDRQSDAEEVCFAVLPARPKVPRDIHRFARDSDYRDAFQKYKADSAEYERLREQAEESVGLAALKEVSRKTAAAAAVVLEEAKQIRATTLEGLVVKARMADQWDSQTMVASVMADLLAVEA